MKIIETTRFYLREFTESDLNLLYSLHANPEVAKTTIDGIQSIEVVKKHLENFILHQGKYSFSQWAVFENKTNKFAGRAGLIKRKLNQEVGEQIEIRFAFLPEFWGQSLASDVGFEIIKFAKEKLKPNKIVAGNSLENEKSARVLVKLGFHHIKNIAPEGYGKSDVIRYWELQF
jgi:RimJ/RimL family protein N-acetyltransferase